jgi:hypothetical protein
MIRTRIGLCIGMSVLLAACGSEVEPGTGTMGGQTGGGATIVPEVPILESVLPVGKVLRVQWKTTSECEAIEGERRTPSVTYAVVFNVPGTDTDYVDEEANSDEEYTYRIRCQIGDVYSEYSNQVSGNPFSAP